MLPVAVAVFNLLAPILILRTVLSFSTCAALARCLFCAEVILGRTTIVSASRVEHRQGHNLTAIELPIVHGTTVRPVL